MATFLLLNGPNLNLLGTREPEVYGQQTLESVVSHLTDLANQQTHTLIHHQSNHEGELVDAIQQAREHCDFIIINPAAYTHTSVALRDALLAVSISFIEVHLSNVHARESFRQQSYFSDIAHGVICGVGVLGYELALRAAIEYCDNHTNSR